MTRDEVMAMGERDRAEFNRQVDEFVEGVRAIDDVTECYRMRALTARIAASEGRIASMDRHLANLEARVRHLEADALDEEGDPSTDYPMGVIL